MEAKEDVDVVRVALNALMRRMTDDQINRVIGELEYVAEERGDRTGESAHAQAAQHLIAVLERPTAVPQWRRGSRARGLRRRRQAPPTNLIKRRR
jgi:hypothetical protein